MENKDAFENTHDILSLQNQDVCIYGAGGIGRIWYYVLKRLGINVVDIQDQNADNIHMMMGVNISKPSYHVSKNTNFLVAIYNKSIRESVLEQVEKEGGTAFAATPSILQEYCREIAKIDSDFSSFRERRCVDCPNFIGDAGRICPVLKKQVLDHFGEDKIVIPVVNAMIVDSCNLSCSGCGQSRDSRANKKALVTASRTLASLKKLNDANIVIPFVEVIGGETFLAKDLKKIIDEVCDLPNVGLIQIATNGTIIPKDTELLKQIATPRINVKISDYSENLTLDKQEKIKTFTDLLNQYNINYFKFRPLWHDFGDCIFRNYTENELIDLAGTCCYRGNTRILINEKLFSCVFRTSFFLPEFDSKLDDLILVDDNSFSDLRKSIEESISRKYFNVCNYCSGDRKLLKTPGVQK